MKIIEYFKQKNVRVINYASLLYKLCLEEPINEQCST